MGGKHPQYYEAVLQLREVSEEAISFVKKQIKLEKIYVAKVKKMPGGYDFYLADKNFTIVLGKQLQRAFKGQVLITTSLIGRKKDKNIHRFTVLFRGIRFSTGGVVEYKGEGYRVKGVAKKILLQNEQSGRKLSLNWKDSQEIKLKE